MKNDNNSNYFQSSKDIDFGKDKEAASLYSQLTGEGLVSTEKKDKKK